MPKTAAEAAPEVTIPTPEPTLAEREAAAVAKLQRMDDEAAEAAAAEEAEAEGEEAAPEEGTEAAKPKPKAKAAPKAAETEDEPRASAYIKKNAQLDRELQQLRGRLKSMVPVETLRQNPMGVLRALGYTDQQIMDAWLATPGQTGTPDVAAEAARQQQAGPPEAQTPAEYAQLRQEIDLLKRALQERDLAAQTRARHEAYQQELGKVHAAIERGGDRWETIAARTGERGLASNKGGADALVIETGQAMWQQRAEALGPGATEEEIREAAPTYEEVMDAVEAWLVEDWQSRSEAMGKVKKLQPKAPETTAEKLAAKAAAKSKTAPKRPGLPAQPAAPTPRRARSRSGLPTPEDEARAIARLEEMDRKARMAGVEMEE